MKQVPDETFRAMLDALYKSLFWLGNSGANADVDHVNRPAWEACRAAIKLAEEV